MNCHCVVKVLDAEVDGELLRLTPICGVMTLSMSSCSRPVSIFAFTDASSIGLNAVLPGPYVRVVSPTPTIQALPPDGVQSVRRLSSLPAARRVVGANLPSGR
jgi:hypothetical protein